MSRWQIEEQVLGLFGIVLVSLLVYLVFRRRRARRLGTAKQTPARGRLVAWMLTGWAVGFFLSANRRVPEAAFIIVHGAILGAVVGAVLDVMRERVEQSRRQLSEPGSPRRSQWRFSLRSLLLFMAVVGMICAYVRLYIVMFIF